MTDRAGRLIIVCGLPGTGKTTVATALAVQHAGLRLSPDDWMDALSIDLWDHETRMGVEKLQWQVAREILTLGGTAVIEWGTWRRAERDALRESARALGAKVELIYLDGEPKVLHERISRRGREQPPITLAQIEEWILAFEVPRPDELALYDPPAKQDPA